MANWRAFWIFGMTTISLAFSATASSRSANEKSIVEVADEVETFSSENELKIFDELRAYLSIPNWARDKQQIDQNIDFVLEAFSRRNIETEVLTTDGASPVVFGNLNKKGAEKTIIVYTHLDGQPVDALEWYGDPFEPVVLAAPFSGNDDLVPETELKLGLRDDWRVIARSASDDKSPLIAVLAAIDALSATGNLPAINIKFFVETEEELGSPSLERILREHKSRFDDGDFWIFADGPMHETGAQQLVFGVRGVTGAELTTYGPNRQLHSGHYGNFAPNPVMRLAHLLSSMRDENGKILIEGIDDKAVNLTTENLKLLRRGLSDRKASLDYIGINESEYPGQFREESVLRTALNLKGIAAAGVGDQARNVVPEKAVASIGFRLVPGISPAQALDALENHILDQGYFIVREEPTNAERQEYEKIIRIDRMNGGYQAAYSDVNDSAAIELVRAVSAIREDLIVVPIAGGSLPLAHFQATFNAPFVIAPIANADNNQHSPNENIRIGNFYDGITLYAIMINQLY